MVTQLTSEEVMERVTNAGARMRNTERLESILGLEELIDLFRETRHKLYNLYPDLDYAQASLLWTLQRFAIRDLWVTFGVGRTGIPETAGGPIMVDISQSLGRFILILLDNPKDAQDLLGHCILQFYALCRLCENELQSPTNEDERWVNLTSSAHSD